MSERDRLAVVKASLKEQRDLVVCLEPRADHDAWWRQHLRGLRGAIEASEAHLAVYERLASEGERASAAAALSLLELEQAAMKEWHDIVVSRPGWAAGPPVGR
ncbi:hypothetical protein DP939_02395 [Spongiactinospora rosea]|uniref:Uncharacterized protein n=1 Tax=Spongiactinospora rosea TaxID=2248750 RepID=A0A366M5T8_9ACTN|nr:hypothetical protein [Spongiactinospora rosea]RBQ21581.1 hypothetical protein DP939_02395 [Spongiactinospora rosea]